MSQPELLKRTVAALESNGIAYMLTGSFASSLQGEPRSTHDIDFVVDMSLQSLTRLAAAFPEPDFFFDLQSAKRAVETKSQFNVIDLATGTKVDFWLLTNDPFNQTRFNRRYSERVHGQFVKVSQPEDTIIMKLRWAEMSGGSEKQMADARGVYELQADKLDLKYIERWIAELKLETLWQQIKDSAQN